MSYLDTNSAEYISARITKEGRKAIAKGAFNIKYFQIGDSEYDYTYPGFNGILTNKSQMVLKPSDKESFIKYPFLISDDLKTTTYGTPIDFSKTFNIRNIVNPSGMVSERKLIGNVYGADVETYFERLPLTKINGTNQIIVTTGSTYTNTTHITILLDELGGLDAEHPSINKNNISLFYQIINLSGNTITLDRKLPNYSGETGYFHILRNNAENEYFEEINSSDYCLPKPTNKTQLNPWTLNVVWGEKLMGSDVNNLDESLYKYNSNTFVSTKQLLGYTSDSGQSHINFTGGTITNPTSYVNDFNEIINVKPSEQRCIAILHFSENNLINDIELSYRYDDFISTLTTTSNSIVLDENGYELSDTDYFEIYLPFLLYHRNSVNSIGALFKMDTNDYFINSTFNSKSKILYRYLLDESSNKVGKVFPNNKIIIFDDQEIVASLDYKSNRNFTLGSPSVSLINTLNHNVDVSDMLTNNITGKTYHITYILERDSSELSKNSLPCNYYSKINTTNVSSNIAIKFSSDSFKFMTDDINNLKEKFLAKKIKILIQETDFDEKPTPDMWKVIDVTSQIGSSTYINPVTLRSTLITINKSDFENANYFDLEELMGINYLGDTTTESITQFGEKIPFHGSVKLIRATDIEQMNFLINLPSTQFLTTQNPTYINGNRKITEISLLDELKNVLVSGKITKPIDRVGTQLLAVKLDF